jgi:eukaryotic-like serine/threonine-protein kinase
MPLPPGSRVGPYEITAAIGAGGMGEVYRAVDTRLGRDVAIKVLPQQLSSPEFRERFDREARSISSLNHARICTLHDVGHQNGIDFLVMELLEGQSLADRLKKGPVPPKETLRIGAEICEALEAAHRAGIIHRDLKPANIMLTRSGVKLMDFGLAKAAVEAVEGNDAGLLLSTAKTLTGGSPISPLTTAGAVVGTIQYMSPEQIEGKPADVRSDIFALGAVLYQCATGKRPFDGKSQISIASAILEKAPEPLSTLQPLGPPALERVVNTCLEKNPDDRFQSARDVRLELKWISEGLGQAAPASTAPAKKDVAALIPWAIAALCALAAGAAFFLSGRERPQPHFTNVTYRLGTLQSARFSRDGQTIVYSGAWEGDLPQLSIARVGNPESRLLGIPSAAVASISSSDELAVLLNCEPVFIADCGGTLATVSLAGGAPRDLAEHVAYADWDPQGTQLLVSLITASGPRLEYPPGHVILQQNSGWFGHPRFSPEGKMIAYENHPTVGDDTGTVEVTDLNGKRTVLSQFETSLEGLAWSPNGKEVWYAGTESSGWADTILAVTLSGRTRAILTMPYLRLHDIDKDGRVLLSHETWRRQMMGFFPGDKAEHAYSWLDDTNPSGITADGRIVSFSESGETYGIANDSQGYYRPTDGSPAVGLGAGVFVISPDGKWLLSASHKSRGLQVQPIGPGESKTLLTPGLKAFAPPSWSDDGGTVVYEAQTEAGDWNVYVQRIAGGLPALVRAHTLQSRPVLSPNGEVVALHVERGGIFTYHVGNPESIPVKGSLETEYPVRFADGGKSLLAIEATGRELIFTLIDLLSGHRQEWKRVDVPVRPLVGFSHTIVVTPDLKYYAYATPRYASDLYIVDNVH